MVAVVAWVVLGAVTHERKDSQHSKLRDGVQNLWGSPQVQAAPALAFQWETQQLVQRTEQEGGVATKTVSELVTQRHEKTLLPDASRIAVDLRSDLRRKGLMWYSLYDVGFAASYRYVHAEPQSGTLL